MIHTHQPTHTTFTASCSHSTLAAPCVCSCQPQFAQNTLHSPACSTLLGGPGSISASKERMHHHQDNHVWLAIHILQGLVLLAVDSHTVLTNKGRQQQREDTDGEGLHLCIVAQEPHHPLVTQPATHCQQRLHQTHHHHTRVHGQPCSVAIAGTQLVANTGVDTAGHTGGSKGTVTERHSEGRDTVRCIPCSLRPGQLYRRSPDLDKRPAPIGQA